MKSPEQQQNTLYKICKHHDLCSLSEDRVNVKLGVTVLEYVLTLIFYHVIDYNYTKLHCFSLFAFRVRGGGGGAK